jgi:hypothetical protein
MACPTIRRRTSCPTTTVARARVYVAGWIKRGPRGVIGSNRACAEETVAQLWDDYADGKPSRQAVGWSGWQTIDAGNEHAASARRGHASSSFPSMTWWPPRKHGRSQRGSASDEMQRRRVDMPLPVDAALKPGYR